MVLYGPYGIGKTTLLLDLETRLWASGVVCARAPQTRSMEDITQAIESAYPNLHPRAVAHRTPGARGWEAAELQGGVLLLDHLTQVSSAMVSFLRWLRSGIMGVITAVDVEVEREQRRLRPWRLGALSIRMPGASADLLRGLLRKHSAELRLPTLDAEVERRLIREARGRPGWIVRCVHLQIEARYWQGTQLFASALCKDTEAALQHDSLERLPQLDDGLAHSAAGDGE
ncbi:MAG TPA: hypothetical protein VHB68_16950 [Steroidobacteraceae bacterium]|nr:hypothetical protein [Steroidobacteraceae bacterium]